MKMTSSLFKSLLSMFERSFTACILLQGHFPIPCFLQVRFNSVVPIPIFAAACFILNEVSIISAFTLMCATSLDVMDVFVFGRMPNRKQESLLLILLKTCSQGYSRYNQSLINARGAVGAMRRYTFLPRDLMCVSWRD